CNTFAPTSPHPFSCSLMYHSVAVALLFILPCYRLQKLLSLTTLVASSLLLQYHALLSNGTHDLFSITNGGIELLVNDKALDARESVIV
ncbi:MAG: hypothetical protein ACK53Y_25740, partial [bacterium]